MFIQINQITICLKNCYIEDISNCITLTIKFTLAYCNMFPCTTVALSKYINSLHAWEEVQRPEALY